MVTTMRFYLSGPLNGQQMDDLSLRFASDAGDYRKDSPGFFIEIRHPHLDLAPEEIISKELKKLSMVKVTLMTGSTWVYQLQHPDGATFDLDEATASYRTFSEKARDKATFLITGKTVDSVLAMLKILKDGDLKSHQDIRKESTELNVKLVDIQQLVDELGSSNRILSGHNRELQEGRETLQMAIAAREKEILWYRLPWWKRLVTNKTTCVIPWKE